VFLTYEYCGEKDKLVDRFGNANGAVVMYSSISTNAFDSYGEQVMGTKGTLILNEEAAAYLFAEGAAKDTRINWAEARVSRPWRRPARPRPGAPVAVADTLPAAATAKQEHLAWLIRTSRNPTPPTRDHMPRCNGEVAMRDAVVTLA